jgi:Rad3-related DNA helicase
MLKYFIKDRKSSCSSFFFSKARRIHKINVRKCVIIFDEAHNIEQQCEDAASVVISSLDLAGCLDDISKIMQWMANSRSSASSELAIEENDENNIDSNGNYLWLIMCIEYCFSFGHYT